MRKAKLRWRLLPLVFAALVLLGPTIQQNWDRHQVAGAAQVAQAKIRAAPKTPPLVEGTPNRIIIPKIAIDLSIVPGGYDPRLKSWSVSPVYANYATDTALLNNHDGQTLIYGHNSKQIFGEAVDLQPRDEVYVYTSNGHIFQYELSSSQDITPTSTGIFDSMKHGVGMKLITCNGAQFEYRHFMSFQLKKVT